MSAPLVNPFAHAASRLDIPMIGALLAYDIQPQPDINERLAGNTESVSPLGAVLSWTRETGDEQALEIVKLLLARGANADTVDPDHTKTYARDPVTRMMVYPKNHLALFSVRRSEAIGRVIFDHLGPEKLKVICEEHPVFHTAVKSNHAWAVRYLLDIGVDLNASVPLHGQPMNSAVHLDMAQLLLHHGAKLHAKDDQGVSVLEKLSAGKHDADFMSLLLKASELETSGKKVDVAALLDTKVSRLRKGEEASDSLINSLFKAIENRQSVSYQTIWTNLGKQRAYEARDSKGRSILHAAVQARDWSLTRRLLRGGMNPNDFDHQGHTAFSIFATLTVTSDEKDRKGWRRAREEVGKAMKELFNPDAVSPSGQCYFDLLWGRNYESFNGIYAHQLFPLLNRPSADGTLDKPWMKRKADGTCFLEQAISHLKAREGNYSHVEFCDYKVLFTMIEQSITCQQMDSALANHFFEQLLGASSSTLWKNATSYRTNQFFSDLEKVTDTLISLKAVDPLPYQWSPELAKKQPELFAKLESWQLHAQTENLLGTSSSEGVKRKTRSL